MDPSGEDSELELEKTVYSQLLELEDQKAELPPDEPTRSELQRTYEVIETGITETLQSIRDGRIARAIDAAGRDADSARINDIAEAELHAQEERERQLDLSRREASQPGSPTSSTSGGPSNPLSATNPKPSDPGSLCSISGDPTKHSRSCEDTDKDIQSVLRLPAGRDKIECIACSDSTTEAYETPCGCFYDRNCITELFNKATADETLFPPKCCTQPIPFEHICALLSPESIQAFKKKSEEFATPNKLYCSNEICSKFIGPAVSTERDKTDVICGSCSTSTCSFCKTASHPAHVPCKNDAETQQVLILGSQSGWMACPSCHHLVERTEGCNDMNCICGYEFCYGCGVKWGSCGHGS